MKRTAIRKQLIFKFLDTKYPDAFVKQTIFGSLAMCGDDSIHTYNLPIELCNWFDVTQDFAKHNIKVWVSTLPVVVSIRNSTNPAVLVSDNTVVNSTL